MKDGRFEMSDLDAMDMHRVVLAILIEKEIVTMEEIEEWKQLVLNAKNEQLEKELEENPGLKLLMDIFSLKSEKGI